MSDRKRILIVEDNTINAEMLSVMIGDKYDIKIATDGLRGLNILKNDLEISCILLDLMMPVMSGREFLMEVNNDPNLRRIPVIVLTSAEDSEAECLSLGAADFIKKPFPQRDVLIERIDNVINSVNSATGYEVDSYINTLFSDYQTLYLIDTNTDSFESFSNDESFRSLGLTESGDNFFDTLAKDIKTVMNEEDYYAIIRNLEKENLMNALHSHHGFSMDCRFILNGEIKHYHLKAMFVPDVNPQIIIGIASTEERVSKIGEMEKICEDKNAFSEISQALAADYFCVYYMHLNSESFIEYFSDDYYSSLGIEKKGENFFSTSIKNILRVVFYEDIDNVLHRFTKENVLTDIGSHKAFTLAYRLVFGTKPVWVLLKAVNLVKNGEDYIVFAVSRIDTNMINL